MFRVLHPGSNLSFNKCGLLQVAWIHIDFWLDTMTRESLQTRDLRHLLQNKFALGR